MNESFRPALLTGWIDSLKTSGSKELQMSFHQNNIRLSKWWLIFRFWMKKTIPLNKLTYAPQSIGHKSHSLDQSEWIPFGYRITKKKLNWNLQTNDLEPFLAILMN